MILSRTYHGLTLDIAKAESSRICYILFPEGLREDGLKWLESAAQTHNANLVIMSGMDWNDDMTPWSAEGVFKKAKPFGGRAETFLKLLRDDYFPGVEASLGIKHPERNLAGISLSGLFAIWSCFRSQTLRGVASISGSLWYDGFAEWETESPLSPKIRRVYISLGDREKNSKDRRMSTVEEETLKVVNDLETKLMPDDGDDVPGLDCNKDEKSKPEPGVKFVLEKGVTHFSPVIPRLDAALSWLF